MIMWGKVIGFCFGYILGMRLGFVGGLIGGLLGFTLGDMFDRGLAKDDQSNASLFDLGDEVRNTFFEATFRVMGFLAKSDGRVSEDEIQSAESIMTRLNLTPELRQEAIRFFSEGKQPEFRWTKTCDKLKKTCAQHYDLLQLFIEFQLEVAYADGELSHFKQQLLLKIADWLGFGEQEFFRLDQMQQARMRFRSKRRSQHRYVPGQTETVDDAYQVLGVKASDSDQAIKLAYRKLMSQHHPDKLVAKGLPEEMMKLATEKTQEIQAAYDRVCRARVRDLR